MSHCKSLQSLTKNVLQQHFVDIHDREYVYKFIDVCKDPDAHADIVVKQAIAICNRITKHALGLRNALARRGWKMFCRAQCARSAGTMHRWTNKDPAIPSVEVFGSKYNHTEPLQAVAS